jgi:hypothetical protein
MRSMIFVIAVTISVAAFAQEQPVPQSQPRVVAAPTDGRSVADFVLMTCLSAVADPAAIDVMARENRWVRLRPPPGGPSRAVRVTPPRWRVDGFLVTMWTPGDGSGNPDVPACFVLIRPFPTGQAG